MAAELHAVPSVVEVVKTLAAAGTDNCIAFNGSLAAIKHRLGITGLRHRFDGRIFSSD